MTGYLKFDFFIGQNLEDFLSNLVKIGRLYPSKKMGDELLSTDEFLYAFLITKNDNGQLIEWVRDQNLNFKYYNQITTDRILFFENLDDELIFRLRWT